MYLMPAYGRGGVDSKEYRNHVFVSRPATSGKKNFRIFPVKYPDDELNANDRNLLGKYNKGIKER